MSKKMLLVDCEHNSTNVCALEDGILQEFYNETAEEVQLTGNIYKGKVTDVVDGLQSAFVDIGLDRTGFWYIGETLVHNTILGEQGALPHTILAKPGDYVMVQAIKEATPLKGPKLTSNISIPGHYLIYLYNLEFIGVSNKILEQEERDRLIGVLKGLAPEGRGFIARTNAKNISEIEIKKEAEYLIRAGEALQKKWDEADGISLIYNEGNLLYRSIRDMIGLNTEKIVCNNEKLASDIREMVSSMCPYFNGEIEIYNRKEDMFDYYNIGDDIYALGQKRVNLPIGGYLVIERTEALTAIDVNTGRFIGSIDREDTVFRTNIDAAKEIARQIRLRNIGGLIVIDFIDMLSEEHKVDVVNALKDELFKDIVKTKVMDMSGLGLVEVSRKKIGKEFGLVSSEKCPYCAGSGNIISQNVLSRMLKLSLKKLFAYKKQQTVFVKVHVSFAEYILKEKVFSKECASDWADKRIYLIPVGDITPGTFQFLDEAETSNSGAVLLQ